MAEQAMDELLDKSFHVDDSKVAHKYLNKKKIDVNNDIIADTNAITKIEPCFKFLTQFMRHT